MSWKPEAVHLFTQISLGKSMAVAWAVWAVWTIKVALNWNKEGPGFCRAFFLVQQTRSWRSTSFKQLVTFRALRSTCLPGCSKST